MGLHFSCLAIVDSLFFQPEIDNLCARPTYYSQPPRVGPEAEWGESSFGKKCGDSVSLEFRKSPYFFRESEPIASSSNIVCLTAWRCGCRKQHPGYLNASRNLFLVMGDFNLFHSDSLSLPIIGSMRACFSASFFRSWPSIGQSPRQLSSNCRLLKRFPWMQRCCSSYGL